MTDMKNIFFIFLLIFSAHSASACLHASQNRIFPLGICSEGLVVMELHGNRGEEIDWGINNELRAEWRATSFLNFYSMDRKLVRSEIIDSIIYIAENEYVSTINKTFEKALYLVTKIKDFVPAQPENFTFCNYQINCSTVNLEIDSVNFSAFLNFPEGGSFEIDVLKNQESIASNYLEQLGAYDYESEDQMKLYIVESLLINSVRQFQIGDYKLTVVHLGMGTNYSEETPKEYAPDFEFTALENSVFEEPVLYHGHGFDFFILE